LCPGRRNCAYNNTQRCGSTGAKAINSRIDSSEFYRVGLDIMGGCCSCGASIACYNAHPSRNGFWKCSDCIGNDGWESVEEYEKYFKSLTEPIFTINREDIIEEMGSHYISEELFQKIESGIRWWVADSWHVILVDIIRQAKADSD